MINSETNIWEDLRGGNELSNLGHITELMLSRQFETYKTKYWVAELPAGKQLCQHGSIEISFREYDLKENFNKFPLWIKNDPQTHHGIWIYDVTAFICFHL